MAGPSGGGRLPESRSPGERVQNDSLDRSRLRAAAFAWPANGDRSASDRFRSVRRAPGRCSRTRSGSERVWCAAASRSGRRRGRAGCERRTRARVKIAEEAKSRTAVVARRNRSPGERISQNNWPGGISAARFGAARPEDGSRLAFERFLSGWRRDIRSLLGNKFGWRTRLTRLSPAGSEGRGPSSWRSRGNPRTVLGPGARPRAGQAADPPPPAGGWMRITRSSVGPGRPPASRFTVPSQSRPSGARAAADSRP